MLRPRPEPHAKSVYRRWLGALALALLFHILAPVIFALSSSSASKTFRPPSAVARPASVRTLSKEQWAKNRTPTATPKARKEEEAKGQVVDVAPGNNERPEDSRFLAERNNRVDKETRSRDQTNDYRNAMPQRTSSQKNESTGAREPQKATARGNRGLSDDPRPVALGAVRPAMEIPSAKRKGSIDLKPTPEGPGASVPKQRESSEIQGNSQKLNVTPGVPGSDAAPSPGSQGIPGIVNLLPSASAVAAITGAPSNDHLRDVAEGPATFLNTREWKYAGFFNRVKQRVSATWSPAEPLRARDPSGQLYGGRDRYTTLNIILDAEGHLRSASVEQSSGLDFLDQEAIRAFQQAQPFPNVPPGLLASDQTVQFQFGFFLEMTGRPGMKLFRTPQ